MPLPNILEFIGTNISQRKFQEAQEKLLNYLGLEVSTKTELNSAISSVNSTISSKADKIYVDTALSGFTNGASKFYPTLSAANADIANIGIKDKVEVGEVANGGVWYKATAGAASLTKSVYDPLIQAKEFTELEISETKKYIDKSVKKGFAKPFFAVAAANDAHVFWVDDNCEIWTFGAPYSINQMIKSLQEIAKPLLKKESGNIFNSVDINGDSYFRVGQNGHLYIFDQKLSIQDQFKVITEQLNSSKQNFNHKSVGVIKKRDLYHSDYLDRINNLKAMCNYICPAPRWMSKQRFTLGQSWLNTIKLTVPDERAVVPGFDPSWNTDIGVVHPHIIEFEQQMAGFKYWLGLNPYTNTQEDIELPFIYGSNDPELKKWELISNFPTPFDRDPPNINGVTSGFCSDSGFVYDVKRGDLIFFWRRTLRYNGKTTEDQITNEIVAKATTDGMNWSDHIWLRDAYAVNNGTELDQMLSPNIVYNVANDLYYMYSISNGKMYYRTTEDIRSRQWSSKVEVALSGFPPGLAMWHFDMRFIGDKLVTMIHTDSIDAYYFAVSTDMHNFISSSMSAVTNSSPNLYKPTFLPIMDENTFKLRCIFTTDQASSPRWQLKVADTTVVSIGD